MERRGRLLKVKLITGWLCRVTGEMTYEEQSFISTNALLSASNSHECQISSPGMMCECPV